MTVDAGNNAHGVSVGQATIYANYSYQQNYTGQLCGISSCPTSWQQASAPANVTPTISQDKQLWYFGGGVPTPPGFTLGSTNATLTANGATSGTFKWTSSDITKLLLEGNAGTVTKTNSNTVGIISSGYSTTANDVTVQLPIYPVGRLPDAGGDLAPQYRLAV